jgi:RNA-directed DNA polymerase
VGPVQLATRADVAALLEIPLARLTWWVVASSPQKRYKRFDILRRNGGVRTIHAPAKPLKEIQQKLAAILTSYYEVPRHVHGFAPERSAVSNARVHRSREWVLRVDLADFFPSIHFGRVRGLFMESPFDCSEEAATLLAQICCFEAQIPQGAPTSPIVSNLICRRLDRDLWRLTRSKACSVTRYADDICLSTDRLRFPSEFAHMEGARTVAGPAIKDVVEENGFELNSEKSRLMHRTQRQRVTGLVINETANLPREYVRGLRSLLHIWRCHGEEDAIAAWRRSGGHPNWPPGKPRPDFAAVVRGRVQYVGSIKGFTNPTYLALAAALEEVDERFVLRHEVDPAPPGGPPPEDQIQALLFTEGKTDVSHVIAAQRYFHRRGEFLGFKLSAGAIPPKRGGDDWLLKTSEIMAAVPQARPCVCLFDRDKDDIVAKSVGDREWKNRGNGVVNVALAGRGDERICIESLYGQHSRETKNEEGRRLFLMVEFDPESGHHESQPFNTPHPDTRRVVADSVYSMEDRRPVSLTKDEFATAIADAEGDFAEVDFEGFRPTFEAIEAAVVVASQALAKQG